MSPLLALSLLLCLVLSLSPATAGSIGACDIEGGGVLPAYPDKNVAVCADTSSPSGCGSKVDIVYVIDGSGSIAAADYILIIEFLQELTSKFQVKDSKVRVGVVQYAGDDSLGVCQTTSSPYSCPVDVLDRFIVQDLSGDPKQVCATLEAPKINDGTPIIQAMAVAHCILLGSSRSQRKMIFITDGQATRGDEITALATQMKAEDISIFSLAIGSGADVALMESIASLPVEDHSYQTQDFQALLTSDFITKFVGDIECAAKERCECWHKPDLLVCPLVQALLEYECGGGTGEFFYDCTEEQHKEENNAYVLWNLLAWVYKFLFVMTVRFVFQCHTIDLGKVNFLCFDFIPLAWLFLLAANLALILLT
jgi:hypothetical protein